jgi:DNA-binding transcriptional ArsR family regulator
VGDKILSIDSAADTVQPAGPVVAMRSSLVLRALASTKRLRILEWLKEPERHFPPQREGDLVTDGVCGILIAAKLRVSQPTASEHLRILSQAGLIRGKRAKKWTFYRRNESSIGRVKELLIQQI